MRGVSLASILAGFSTAANLPVQRVTKVELVINLKAAKTLRINFPLTLLGRADEVIEQSFSLRRSSPLMAHVRHAGG
jgi:putative ABC transport system substrate-binding protein